MKWTKQETLYHKDHGATLKHKCEKKIVALSLFNSFLFFFFGPFSFFGTMLYEWWSSHFYSFTTQWLQLDTRTKYDSIWMPPAVYRVSNESRVTYMKNLWTVALPQIRCQLHDHAKQYDNDGACHNKRNGGKLHGNISRNGYGNAIIGRYGGCFEEDIRRFMCDRAYRITGFGRTGEVCTHSQGEKGQ